jgi:Rrf2 family cysteine metabolism transcriptional repressor
MKITREEDFAMIFMISLAENYSKGFISLSNIADKNKLSPLFLKHIVSKLLKNGLIKSREGLYGGYKLAKSSGSISIAQILKAISEDVIIPYCLHRNCRVREKDCFCLPFWLKINRKIYSYLDNIKLSDLLQK